MANINVLPSRPMPSWYLQEITITPLVGGGLSHQLRIVSGGFTFEGNFDNDFHNFAACVASAMKFFGVQYGMITVDEHGNVTPTPRARGN